jgi:Transposase DDE domain
VPFALPLGQVSQAKRGRETPYLARPAGQYSYSNHHYSRPDSRSQHSRAANFRSWRVLSDGPGLSRLSPVTSAPFSLGLLCHPRPQKIRLPAPLLCARRPQIVTLTNPVPRAGFPEKLRRIRFFDRQQERRLVFLTNNFTLPPLTVAQLYRSRWQVELLFKWIKQHLRIRKFYGTSENALKTQIWIAISVYVLVAIVKKQLKLEGSLYRILQILSVSLFEKNPILEALSLSDCEMELTTPCKQLILFH